MAEPDPHTRADAIDGFAAALRELRQSVGTPSFRELAGRSGAISHTTLHDAAQGHRMPSWATTVEFVKACGDNPAEYRQRWEHARRDLRTAGGESVDPDEPVVEPVAPGTTAAVPAVRRNRGRIAFAVGAAALVVVAGVGVGVAMAGGDERKDAGPSGSAPVTGRQLADKRCPIQQTNPPSAPPRHRGDKSVFIADISLPDCTPVEPGSTRTKIWRLKNIGTVVWRGYTLHRVDQPQRRTDCQTINDIPIRTTKPGQTVDVRVAVTAPSAPTFCFVRFKMQDASGRMTFPASRPVNFQLVVK